MLILYSKYISTSRPLDLLPPTTSFESLSCLELEEKGERVTKMRRLKTRKGNHIVTFTSANARFVK
jgi:hypothetical protein